MRKGYFFTLDAFVATGILVIGLVLIIVAYSYSPITVQGSLIGNDYLLSLSNTKVTDVNKDYVRNLTRNGTITNLDNSLLQQVGEFYFNNQVSMGSDFVLNVTKDMVPAQFGLNVSINNRQIFYRPSLTRSAKLMLSSKTIVFGIYNGSMWGPFPAEVRVWQ